MKHFICYYKQGTGTYIITEPRPWAKENQHLFPAYDFINNIPTTNAVEDFLIENYNFQLQVFPPLVSILFNFNPHVNL